MYQQQTAQRVLTQFQENPDAWQRVPAVLETSGNLNTKVRKRPFTEPLIVEGRLIM